MKAKTILSAKAKVKRTRFLRTVAEGGVRAFITRAGSDNHLAGSVSRQHRATKGKLVGVNITPAEYLTLERAGMVGRFADTSVYLTEVGRDQLQ